MAKELYKPSDVNPQSPRSCKRACTALDSINYQKVAYIGLRNPDGSYLINIPIYVRVSELNKNGMTDMQEDLILRISEKMMKRYEKQISEFLASHKGEVKNESVISG